jgi:hypothetical protein
MSVMTFDEEECSNDYDEIQESRHGISPEMGYNKKFSKNYTKRETTIEEIEKDSTDSDKRKF